MQDEGGGAEDGGRSPEDIVGWRKHSPRVIEPQHDTGGFRSLGRSAGGYSYSELAAPHAAAWGVRHLHPLQNVHVRVRVANTAVPLP